jgi:rSAM/selenodomain-associated transferase 2/rSAM/selenodomain-associated transferase 1
MVKNYNKLIVFTRYPEPGKTKTRLISALGEEGAAKLQKCMTEHMILTVKKLTVNFPLDTEIRFDGAHIHHMKKWLGSDFRFRQQGCGDIGMRMARSFADSFKEDADKVVIIGTDCPDITGEIIIKAFKMLTTHNVVIGPAADGGYYLIGLTKMIPTLFMNIEWGTDRVLKKTQKIIEHEGLHSAYLDELNDIDRPEDISIWERVKKKNRNQLISVIIPAFNEEDNIVSTILSLQRTTCKGIEIIVVDGGSTDSTVESARKAGVKVIMSSKGRARQMNAGAEEARGEILLFLHADTIVPKGFDYYIYQLLTNFGVVLGAFRLCIDAPGKFLRIIEKVANMRSQYLHMPYGDQAFFIKKSNFKEAGGFDDMPIMEDFVFVKAMQKRGQIAIAPLSVVTSARRWVRVGPVRTTLINWAIITAFSFGAPSHRLARWYGRSL